MSDDIKQPDATTPKKGGFGAFSQQYRDRWAANHPRPTEGSADATSASVTAPEASSAADVPLPDAGTQS